MTRAIITIDCPSPFAESHVGFIIQGALPTMDLINALDCLMNSLCLDVIGPETTDSPELARRMKDHILFGRYKLLRPDDVPTPQTEELK